MTILFKSTRPDIAVTTRSVVGAAADTTDDLTNEAAVSEASSPMTSLTELTRHLMSHPSDEAALSAVCAALSDGADIDELVALLAWCSNSEQGESFSAYTMAELSFRIAKGSTGAHARELCRTALDLCPVHVAALSLFEELADPSCTDELWARYQIFLEDAPAHDVSPDICQAVTNKLVEGERDAALKHQEFEDLYNLSDSLRRAFALGVSEVANVAERQLLDVLSLQA